MSIINSVRIVYISGGTDMKGFIMNIIIVLLVAANIFTGALNYCVKQPKCIYDDCNRIRVSGSHYCHGHEGFESERKLCQKVTSKNSK